MGFECWTLGEVEDAMCERKHLLRINSNGRREPLNCVQSDSSGRAFSEDLSNDGRDFNLTETGQ
jgi:hypothetical protein